MSAASTPKNAKWTDPEILAMLNTLIGKKSSHQSGTGWKPSVWTDVVNAVQQVDPTADPVKDKAKVMSKLNDVKDIFTLYLFVEKFSGTGWDDEENMLLIHPSISRPSSRCVPAIFCGPCTHNPFDRLTERLMRVVSKSLVLSTRSSMNYMTDSRTAQPANMSSISRRKPSASRAARLTRRIPLFPLPLLPHLTLLR
ncbi:hypothetical protein K438DRAFT_876688 [Mycena galopus ATCC 62051]|nr:hypothetical protein K438DRAFT_876688 [Mycena galopus ATCC 62051]